MKLKDAESLLSRRKRWSGLSEPDLVDFLVAAFAASAVNPDPQLRAACATLHDHAVGALPPFQRADVVVRLQEVLERIGRHYKTGPINVLTPFVLSDPDAVVVATASAAAAQIFETTPDDPLAGPRFVLEVAKAAPGHTRQAAILSGLAALGDARVFSLLDEAWPAFARDTQEEVLRAMGRHAPTMAGIDFMASRLERAADLGPDHLVPAVVASLVRVAEAARDPGNPRTRGEGVPEIERRFPSWSVPEPVDSIQIVRIHTVGAIARRLVSRLARAAAAEEHARLISIALRAWGEAGGTSANVERGAVVVGASDDGSCIDSASRSPSRPQRTGIATMSTSRERRAEWVSAKRVGKRTDETAVLRPVRDREDDALERVGERRRKPLVEDARHEGGLDPEGAAAPRAEHELAGAMPDGGGEHLARALAHHGGHLGQTVRGVVFQGGGIRGRAREDRRVPGLVEQLSFVGAEERDLGGVDHVIRGHLVAKVPVERIHLPVLQARGEPGRAREGFFLRSSAGAEAAAGVGPRREVQDGHGAVRRQAAADDEDGLVFDGDAVRSTSIEHVGDLSVRRVLHGVPHGSLECGPQVNPAARRGAIATLFEDLDGFAREFGRAFEGYEGHRAKRRSSSCESAFPSALERRDPEVV